jgi:hypothetical protein
MSDRSDIHPKITDELYSHNEKAISVNRFKGKIKFVYTIYFAQILLNLKPWWKIEQAHCSAQKPEAAIIGR